MNYLPPGRKFPRPLMTFANVWDPNEAPQNVGLYQRSIQIVFYFDRLYTCTHIFFKETKSFCKLNKITGRALVNPFSTETVLLVGYWSPITYTLLYT